MPNNSDSIRSSFEEHLRSAQITYESSSNRQRVEFIEPTRRRGSNIIPKFSTNSPVSNTAPRGRAISTDDYIYEKNESLNLSKKEAMTKVKDEITGDLLDRARVVQSKKNLSFNKDTGEVVFDTCYTSQPHYEAVVIDDNGNSYKVVTRQEAIKSKFKEVFNSGKFFTSSNAKKLYDKKRSPTQDFQGIKKFKKGDKKHNMKYGMWSPTDIITEGKGYTMGIEIETSSGHVPFHLYNELNMDAVYDGSIRDKNNNKVGKEYVTGVLQGDLGFFHLQKILNQLAKRTTVNRSCSVHVHIGNVDFSQEFIVYAYLLSNKIEKDIFSILPPSRRGNQYCHPLKKKNFNLSNNLPKEEYNILVEEAYNDIFYYLSSQKPSKSFNKFTNYNRHGAGGYNTNSPRYAWLNFIPCVFNIRNVREFKNDVEKLKYDQGDISAGEIKSYTLEFRNHSGSTNFKKVKNWILICMAYVYYVENNKQAILDKKTVTLEDIVKFAYPKTSERLLTYIAKRRKDFNSDEASEFEKEDYKKLRVTSVKDENIKELVKRK